MTRTKLTPHRTTGLAAALLAAALAKPDPAVGQSWAALVSAETACRAEPSPAADAVGMLEVGNVILVNRSVSALAGQWMHVVPDRSGGYVIPGGCWAPSANVARTTETEHFLQLADRLLSSNVRPALDELLAVHNLFGRPWNREQVVASAALTERRTALLARAVEVAQGPQWGGLRPADDPLVLAWLESLGEQVRYSEGRSGRGRWTVVMGAPEGEEEPSRSRQVESAAAPEGRGMAVIAPDVACRTRPSRTAWSWTTLPVDLHFRTERADTSVAGDAWVFVREQGCWVLAAHTATGGTDEHVLAIADRFLTSGEAWSFGWSGWDRSGEEITRELLATLEGVSEEDKAPLLEMLGGLNRCAGDGG